MSSPPPIGTQTPSPSRVRIDRSVTAPELAAALHRQFTQHGPRRKTLGCDNDELPYPDHGSWERPPPTVSRTKTDPINDLGPADDASSDRDSREPAARFFSLPSPRAWKLYFMQEVASDSFLEFQLLLMTVSTGCLDAMTYTTYNVFSSKQTGNVLFLALHAFRVPGAIRPRVEENIGVSIGTFILGAALFGHLGRCCRPRRRIWLLVFNAFQALLVLAAAAIRYFAARGRTGPGVCGIIALLALAESGQIANALHVGMPELNTTMITGALIQLCTDPKLFLLRNPKRDRRFAFLASMFLGCFIGAAVTRFSSPSAVLVVTASTKGLLFLTFFFNRGLVERRCRLEDGGEKVEGAVTPARQVLWGDALAVIENEADGEHGRKAEG